MPSINISEKQITLYDCFKEHIKIDSVDEWRCEQCNKIPESNEKTIKFLSFKISLISNIKARKYLNFLPYVSQIFEDKVINSTDL